MNNYDFNSIVDEQLNNCSNTLLLKGKDYAEKAVFDDNVDRLEHFKKAAALQGTTPKKAVLGMMTKHTVSVADMCSGGSYSLEKWNEKITDSINYLLILKAIVAEEAANEENRSCSSES